VVTRPLSHTNDARLAAPPARSQEVEAFGGSGPPEDRYRYQWLDAKVENVRDGAQVVRERPCGRARCAETRRIEVIGLDVGEADTEAF
jgi:hypothetical protein